MQQLRSLPSSRREEILSSFSDRELAALYYDFWGSWARPNQLPPAGDWATWLIQAGRGFGKTRVGAEWIVDGAMRGIDRQAIVGSTTSDVRDTMVEGESGILACSPPWFTPIWRPSIRLLLFPNNMRVKGFSAEKPGRLRGPQHTRAWVDELAAWKWNATETWDNLQMGLRIGDDPCTLVTTTPKPKRLIKAIREASDTVITRGTTYDNLHNLAPKFRERVVAKYEGTTIGEQELKGRYLDEHVGANWTRSLIQETRRKEYPQLRRIVVAVDPAASSGVHGIVAGGVARIDGKDHGFVLTDVSRPGTPLQWGKAAVRQYKSLKADRIVGEVNNGGDMVGHVVKSYDAGVAYKDVRASRGKSARAEPIVALYEQDRIHHIGVHEDLEDQQCTWVEGESDESPDRMDALVWCMTELMLGPDGAVGAVDPDRGHRGRAAP